MSENPEVILASSEDLGARQKHVEIADSENRIDGIFRDPRTDVIFNAYLSGEITAADLVPRLRTLLETK